MASFNRYQVEWRNSAVGAGNPAFTRFDLGITGTPSADELAVILSYCVGPGSNAVNTSIAGATVQPNGVGSLIPLAFPIAEYAARRAVNTFLPNMAAFNVAFGSSSLTVAGSSVTVSTYADPSFGRKGHGRHYRPFVGSNVVDGAGALAGVNAAGIQEAYGACFLGFPGATWVGATYLNPLVVNAARTTQHNVLQALVSNTIANLHTRRR